MSDGIGQKASDLFIQCLEEEGCEYIFGVPGEENLDFLDSLSRSTKIAVVSMRSLVSGCRAVSPLETLVTGTTPAGNCTRFHNIE